MARTCTWDGGAADALASSGANWDTDVAPVAGDSIVFPTTTKACTWDLNISLVTLDIQSGYVQTITQNSGANMTFSGNATVTGACTLTLNSGATFSCAAWSQTAGTVNQGGTFTTTTFGCTGTAVFVGSSASISTTAVTHSNTAALTATSGTWTLAGSWTKNNTPTFTHNSGTINITATSTFSPAVTLNLVTINSAGSIVISSGTTCPLGSAPSTTVTSATLTINGTVTYSGAWAHIGNLTTASTSTVTGSSTPSLSVGGSLTLDSGGTWTSVNITATGETGTYTDTGAKNSGTWTINKTGNLIVAASTTMALGASPTSTVTTSTLTVTGTLTYGGTWTHTGGITVSATTGTVTGSSTPALSITGSLNISATAAGWTSVNVTCIGTAATVYTDTGAKNSGIWTVTKSASVSVTAAASTTMNLGTNPITSTTAGNDIGGPGTIQWAGLWTHTGSINMNAATSVLTGSSSPTISVTSNVSIHASMTITNPIATITHTATGTITDTGDKLSASTFVFNGSGTRVVAASTTVRLGAAPTVNISTSTMTVTGTLTYSGLMTFTGSLTVSATTGTVTGAATPSLAITGNLNISPTAAGWTSVNVLCNGTPGTTYTDTGAKNSGTWTINKTASVGFVVAASTTCNIGANPVSAQVAGTMQIDGTLTYSGAWSHTGLLTVSAGATVTGTSTPSLSIDRNLTISATATWTNVNITTTTANQCIYTDTGAKNSGTWTVNKSGNFIVSASTTCALGATPTSTTGTATFTVTGTVTYSGLWTHTGLLTVSATTGTVTGSSTPSLAIGGDLNISATAAGWTSVNITLIGVLGCTYTDTGAKNSGLWTINLSVGGVAVAASTTMNLGASPTCTFGSAGTFTVNGTLTVSGAWVFSGTFNLTVGATGVVSGALTSMTTTRNFTLTAGGVFPTGVNMHFTVLGTVTAVGLTFGTCDINCAVGAFTIAANTTIPLGANPTSLTALGLTVTGTATWSGTWTGTGDYTAAGTLTGTSTPVIVVTEGTATFTGVTFTNAVGIVMSQTSSTARTFTGGAKTYTTFRRVGSGSGTLTVADSNTFTSFADHGSVAHLLKFSSLATTTSGAWDLHFPPGSSLTSTSAASAAVLHSTGTDPIIVEGAAIQDITVDISPVWYVGGGSALGTGNTNWVAGASVGSGGTAAVTLARRRRK